MIRQVLHLLLISLLAGCAIQPSEKPDLGAGRAALVEAENWQFRGRMALKVEDPALGDQVKGGQANIRWQQERDISRIRLSGPMGAGAWELVRSPEALTASDAGGERSIRYTGPEAAEMFMRRELGWAFPADNLRYWLRGVPAPGAEAEETFAEDGRLSRILQQDWDISYDRYGNFDDMLLPARLTIRGRGMRLRLVITRWEISASPG